MKKYLVILLGLTLLAFTSCNVENPEFSDVPDQAEETHLTVNFNITRADVPGTKAQKTGWEEGDVILFFFDKNMDAEYLSLLYKNGAWDVLWSNINYSLEQAIAAKGSGTVTGLYVFGRKSGRHGYWVEHEFKLMDFFADDINTLQQKAYTWFLSCEDTAYSVVNGALNGTINFTMPASIDFVQFSIPGLSGDPGQYTLTTDPIISSCTIYRYDYNDGIMTEPHPDNLMPGYEYGGGLVFCGVLPTALNGVVTDYTFTLRNTADGKTYEYKASGKTLSRAAAIALPQLSSWTPVSSAASDEYVDLGLPSGVKWGIKNLGANTETGMGDQYIWGHTTPGGISSWSEYNFYVSGTNDDIVFSKYLKTGSENVHLELVDDAANASLGGNWRMPTIQEWRELLENCTVAAETVGAIAGYRITSNISGFQDKSIFLPAGSWDWYWSATLSYFDSICAQFYFPADNSFSNAQRNVMMYIRPVYDDGAGGAPDPVAKVAMCEVNGKTLYVAEKNLGATSPEDPGKYYAWGETTGYTSSDSHYFYGYTYAFSVNGSSEVFSKYVYSSETTHWGGTGSPDNLLQLQRVDDAANVALGGNWHMPTDDEIFALLDDCDWTWDSTKAGYIVSGRGDYAGNSIFLPAGGECYGYIGSDLSDIGTYGGYWGSELSSPSQYHDGSTFANYIGFTSSYKYLSSSAREFGRNIRPVRQ